MKYIYNSKKMVFTRETGTFKFHLNWMTALPFVDEISRRQGNQLNFIFIAFIYIQYMHENNKIILILSFIKNI